VEDRPEPVEQQEQADGAEPAPDRGQWAEAGDDADRDQHDPDLEGALGDPVAVVTQ
jgi:hypothetical protein